MLCWELRIEAHGPSTLQAPPGPSPPKKKRRSGTISTITPVLLTHVGIKYLLLFNSYESFNIPYPPRTQMMDDEYEGKSREKTSQFFSERKRKGEKLLVADAVADMAGFMVASAAKKC
jgi:hypothetical protein